MSRSRSWQPRLNEPDQRRRQDEHGESPYPQRGSESVMVEKVFEEERDCKTAEPSTRPHHSVGKSLAFDEPFIHVEHTGAVADGAADGIEDSLSEDEVRDVLRKGGDGESNTEEQQTDDRCVSSWLWVHPLKGHDDWNIEIHDALFGVSMAMYSG